MGRYKTEHQIVDVSSIPLLSALAKKTVITDQKIGKKVEGHDWKSFQASDRRAWEKLRHEK